MRAAYQLTPSAPTVTIQVQNFRAAMLFVENPTGSIVLVRSGGNDVPTSSTADHRVPAGGFLLVPADGTQFAATFADPASVVSVGNANIGTVATVWILDGSELPPSFGALNYQTLSLSPLTSGFVSASGITTSPAWDIGSWGGVLLYVLLSGSSGQAIARVQASANGTTWQEVAAYACWPGIPVTITVARVARYVRLVLDSTSIPSEPAIAGVYAARASLAEITTTSYSAGTAAFTKAYAAVVLGGTVSTTICTVGLGAANVRLLASTGVGTIRLSWYTSDVPSTGYTLVGVREQVISTPTDPGWQRSIGQLGNYLRLDVTAVTTTSSGSLYLAIGDEPDPTGNLDNIYRALGDVGQSSTVDTIYRRLVNIEADTAQIDADIVSGLAGVDASVDAILAEMRRYSGYGFIPVTSVGSSTWTSGGTTALAPYLGGYLIAMFVSYNRGGSFVAPGQIHIGIGNAVGPNEFAYSMIEDGPYGVGAILTFFSPVAGGKYLTPARDTLWVFTDSVNVYVTVNLIARAP